VIDLQAICIATKTGSESNVKYESATIALEIPYHSSNNTSIDRLGQSNIKYDSTTKDLSSSVSTDALDSSDVSDIFNLRPEMAFNGTYWANKESMNLLAPSWINTTSTSNADRTYSGFSVKAANGVQFYSDEYTDSNPATQAEKDYKQFDSDFSYGNYVPAYDVSGFTTNSDLIQRYQYTTTGKALWGRGGGNVNPWDMIVGWEFWMLGDYHGKTFAVKVAFQHVSLIADWFDTTQPLTNRITAQVIGAYCLTSNCSRKDDGSGDNDTKTTLTWTDGTQVVFDETGGDDMTGYGDSSYLYTTTATGSINK
jgi:hypothetical protein